MTIQDLGSIGELIAAIATVATLAYLAIQIRQNTLSTRDTNVRATHDMILRVNSAAIDSPDLVDLLIRGGRDRGSLDPVELTRFHLHWMNSFFMYQEVFRVERSLVEPYLRKGTESHMFQFLKTPGLASWWEENRHRFSDEFRDYVDANRSPREGSRLARSDIAVKAP